MDRLALPYRIVLVAVLAVCAVWFTVLRPKPVEEDYSIPATPAAPAAGAKAEGGKAAPGTAGLKRAVDKATAAVGTSTSSAAATQAAVEAATSGTQTTATGTGAAKAKAKAEVQPVVAPKPERVVKGAAGAPVPTSAAAAQASVPKATAAAPKTAGPKTAAAAPKTAAAPTTAAAPKAATATKSPSTTDPSVALLEAASAGKVVAVLFINPKAPEDRRFRAILDDVDTHGGRVVTRVASIEDVGRYEALTRAVQVQQSPTLVVVSPKGKARTIVGFTVSSEVDQMLTDALRAVK